MAFSRNHGRAGSRILKMGQGVHRPKSPRERGRPPAQPGGASRVLHQVGRAGPSVLGLRVWPEETDGQRLQTPWRQGRERKQEMSDGESRLGVAGGGGGGGKRPVFPARSASSGCKSLSLSGDLLYHCLISLRD